MNGEFNHCTFADLRLVLRSSQGGTCNSSNLAGDGFPSKRQCTGSLDEDFCVHKALIAKKSPVMRAMLLRAKELRDLQVMDDGLRANVLVSTPASQLIDPELETLELPVEQEELLACEVLFRYLYSDDLAEEVETALSSEQAAGVSRVMLLVQLYRLADRLEVHTDQCAQAISALSAADCESAHDVNFVFSLKKTAPALVEHATIKALLERSMSQLVQRFGIIRKVLWRGKLFEEFKQLDFLTVLEFFDSNNLEVKSENEILLLMAVWIGEDWASSVSKEQLGALLNVLRLGHLSTSFLSNLTDIAPWLSVDPVVLGHVAAWRSSRFRNPGKDVSLPKELHSVYGSTVAWFKDRRKHVGHGAHSDYCFSGVDLAKLLTEMQYAGSLEGLHKIWAARRGLFNGYDIHPMLSIETVFDGSKETYVISVGFDFRTSAAYMSEGIKTLAHVKADYRFGKGIADELPMGSVAKLLYGTHSWEVIKVDTLDDFSCLDSKLGEEGKLPIRLTFYTID